jgi:hypothetical protein
MILKAQRGGIRLELRQSEGEMTLARLRTI